MSKAVALCFLQIDYQQDPLLASACKIEIEKFCLPSVLNDLQATDDRGRVQECLREHLTASKVTNTMCIKQIARVCTCILLWNLSREDPDFFRSDKLLLYVWKKICLVGSLFINQVLAEDRADVHVDPLLYRACALDLKHYCFDVPQGEGKQMSCLLAALDDKKVQLRKDCRKMLQVSVY